MGRSGVAPASARESARPMRRRPDLDTSVSWASAISKAGRVSAVGAAEQMYARNDEDGNAPQLVATVWVCHAPTAPAAARSAGCLRAISDAVQRREMPHRDERSDARRSADLGDALQPRGAQPGPRGRVPSIPPMSIIAAGACSPRRNRGMTSVPPARTRASVPHRLSSSTASATLRTLQYCTAASPLAAQRVGNSLTDGVHRPWVQLTSTFIERGASQGVEAVAIDRRLARQSDFEIVDQNLRMQPAKGCGHFCHRHQLADIYDFWSSQDQHWTSLTARLSPPNLAAIHSLPQASASSQKSSGVSGTRKYAARSASPIARRTASATPSRAAAEMFTLNRCACAASSLSSVNVVLVVAITLVISANC